MTAWGSGVQPPRDSRGDSGAAVVEFVMVSVILIALFLAILDLGLTLFVRNTLVATAAEGARYGANADRDASDAKDHTVAMLSDSLAGNWADNVTAGYETVGGVRTVVVQVTASIPALGFIDLIPPLTVRGHAFDEGAGP